MLVQTQLRIPKSQLQKLTFSSFSFKTYGQMGAESSTGGGEKTS